MHSTAGRSWTIRSGVRLMAERPGRRCRYRKMAMAGQAGGASSETGAAALVQVGRSQPIRDETYPLPFASSALGELRHEVPYLRRSCHRPVPELLEVLLSGPRRCVLSEVSGVSKPSAVKLRSVVPRYALEALQREGLVTLRTHRVGCMGIQMWYRAGEEPPRRRDCSRMTFDEMKSWAEVTL
jgi:hypothetical protein